MSDGTWLDPWLALREKTASRNDLLEIADCYSRMSRLACQQLNRLKDRPKTKKETIDGLRFIIAFCEERHTPLFEKVQQLDVQIFEETERLNNE